MDVLALSMAVGREQCGHRGMAFSCPAEETPEERHFRTISSPQRHILPDTGDTSGKRSDSMVTHLRRLHRRVILGLVLAATYSGVFAASDLADALRAIRLRQFDKAIAIMTPMAQSGHADAQFALGSLYRSGSGVPVDHEGAFHWFEQAAGQGHAKAQFNLGYMLEQGLGTKRDPERADFWYHQAATQNHAMARARLENQNRSESGMAAVPLQPADESGSVTANQRLRWAAQTGRVAPVLSALHAGADIDHRDRYGRTVLMDASEAGHREAVSRLLEFGADSGAKDHRGDSALLFAARRGHADVIATLLNNGVDENSRDALGNTALMIAAASDCLRCIDVLSNAGAVVDLTNKKGETALDLAAGSGHRSSVVLLRRFGAKERKRQHRTPTVPIKTLESIQVASKDQKKRPFENWSPAMIAASRGQLDAVNRLLAKYPDELEAQDEEGYTLLSRAAEQGHKAVVRSLISKGIGIDRANRAGDTALHLAAREGHGAIVGILLDAGAAIDRKSKHGLSPLLESLSRGHINTAMMLVDRGADVDSKGRAGRTALIHATALKNRALSESILRRNPNIDSVDSSGRTAVWHAVSSGWIQGVKVLVQHGADVDIADSAGITPLACAVHEGFPEIFRFLFENGADTRLSEKATGDNLLMVIAASGMTQLASQLLAKHETLDVNQRNRHGDTALMRAIGGNHTAMVQFLLKRDADPNLRNDKHENARQIAEQSGKKQIVALIDSYFPYSRLLDKLY